VTILGLASMIAEVLGVPARPRLEPARGGEVRHSLADVDRMESVLGFRPPVDLRRGLALAAEWYAPKPKGKAKAKGAAAPAPGVGGGGGAP
jgi:nucleoside-diphosphate-sugar epimerase